MSDQDFQPVPRPDDDAHFDTELNREFVTSVPTIIAESKAGYKTTEFWVGIVLSLLTVLDTVPLPEKFEGLVVGAIGLAYILSRGIAKKGIPVVETPPSS